MSPLTAVDLFTGIGGVCRGLEGLVAPVLHCDISQDCQNVLRARMEDGSIPPCQIVGDIKELTFDESHREPVQIILSSWPCTGLSIMGKSEGFGNPHSALFYEVMRLIDETKAPAVFFENVPRVLTLVMDDVIHELNTLRGYDVRWIVVPASAVGAPHVRSAVVPDCARLAFMMLVSGFRETDVEASTLEFQHPDIESSSVRLVDVTCKGWPRVGFLGNTEEGPLVYAVRLPAFKRPRLHIRLRGHDAIPEKLFKLVSTPIVLGERSIPSWSTPRFGSIWACNVLTERSIRDLPIQLRFAIDTPADQKSWHMSADFCTWLMGFPPAYTVTRAPPGSPRIPKMAPTVGVKRKAATITLAADTDGGRAKSVRDAKGWAADWGATIRALTATKQGGEDAGYRADTMRSPRGGLLVDSDRSMRRRLISDINQGRSEMSSMLAEMRDSGRVPPFMDERDRQLRYRVAVFRKRLIGEGREFREELIPEWTGRCAMCLREGLPLKEMGLVDYEWACGSCRSGSRDHSIRDGVRRKIDEWLAELSRTTTGELNETILQLRDVRDKIVKLASERKTSGEEEVEREVVREWEKRAFETIYCNAPLEELDARSLTLKELDEMRTSETKLRDDVAKQHQTVFYERNLLTLIGNSVKRRQSDYIRRFEARERKFLKTDEAICRWNEQDIPAFFDVPLRDLQHSITKLTDEAKTAAAELRVERRKMHQQFVVLHENL
ncbi:S-adenosyl-L-methionine-dependent methyltransferase superfamily protein [Klebsormidium nitens]|uniref:S-adenosyl-L-methionine-dependent methyltransferase superfamily protein n=1 Tax=Klebsormidium nitens TaxID=105231 RepID=A0A1Y1IAK2_KLENI|nr:S-adenosyl-L-methionine-dependent methyltransferase superfamily protein [Klebsormidium nitens]|eukprot:GAQ87950.1 S-adenosyl-L-methionine-dependent methyltransferase superfamily protein [Klebsormidium nitens]